MMSVQFSPLSTLSAKPRATMPRAAQQPESAPRFGKSAEDSMGYGLLAIFSLIGLGASLAIGTGAQLWHRHSNFSMGSSTQVLQGTLDNFQSVKNLPSENTPKFRALLERIQEQVAINQANPSTEQLKNLVPELTAEDLQTVSKIMDQAKDITAAKDLMPVFTPWLDILEKHGGQKLDRAQIQKDAEEYFTDLKGYNRNQNILLGLMVAGAVISGLGLRTAIKNA